MKNGIENFNSSTNDGNLIVQHPMLILLVYEVLMCNKLKHIVKELVMHPSRCTSSTANCDLIRFVSKLAVFDSSVFSLSQSPCTHTHIDLPDEADTAQRNRQQPHSQQRSSIHSVYSLQYFILHTYSGSSPSLHRIDHTERKERNRVQRRRGATRPENPTRHFVPLITLITLLPQSSPLHTLLSTPTHYERQRPLSRCAIERSDFESVINCTHRRGPSCRQPAHIQRH